MKIERWNVRTLLIMSLIIYTLLQVYTFFYGIRTLTGSGFGNDGARYADWVMNKLEIIDYFKSLSSYHIQRVLPGIIVHYLIVFFNLNLQNPDIIIKTFLLFDHVMVVLTIIGMFSLARYLKWTPEATFVALTTLICNFLFLKQMYHYTILTDYAAFAIGFFQIYFYIKKQNVYLYLISIIGVFVWPTLLLTGLLMMIFKAEMVQTKRSNPTFDFYSKTKPWKVVAIVFLLSAIGTSLFYFEQQNLYLYLINYYSQEELLKSRYLFFPAIFIILLYVAYVVMPFSLVFFKDVFRRRNLSKQFFGNVAIAIITFVTVNLLIHYLSNPNLPLPASFISFMLRPIYPVLSPGLFAIAYAQFFGLGMLLFMFLYPKMNYNLISSVGALSVLFMLFFVFFEPEPRQAINYFPVIAVLLGSYLSQQKISISFCFYYTLLAYLFSRSWLPNFYPYAPKFPYLHTGLISIPIGLMLLYLLLKKHKMLTKDPVLE